MFLLAWRGGGFSILDGAMMVCPDCYEELPEGARRCRACGRWLRDSRQCPQCGETVLAAACVCRYCHYDLVGDPINQPPLSRQIEGLPHTLEATPLGGMICQSSLTALFLPPRLEIREDEIVVTQWSWLGLRTYEQKVALARVASVRKLSGIIWAGLVIETFGGAIGNLAINGLDKNEAQQTVDLLERITQLNKKKAAPAPAQ